MTWKCILIWLYSWPSTTKFLIASLNVLGLIIRVATGYPPGKACAAAAYSKFKVVILWCKCEEFISFTVLLPTWESVIHGRCESRSKTVKGVNGKSLGITINQGTLVLFGNRQAPFQPVELAVYIERQDIFHGLRTWRQSNFWSRSVCKWDWTSIHMQM